MPKKTKKQKIMAEYRKKIQTLQIDKNIPIEKKQFITEVKNENNNKIKYSLSEQDKIVATHTLSDLKKTLIITSIILLLEFFIFFANLKHINLGSF